MITFTVYGLPLPKGSARAFVPKGWSRPIITSATKGLKEWERRIASVAQSHASGQLLSGALSLTVTFYLPRPASLPKRMQQHTKRPDLDKLIRGATDALTKVLWNDDAQLVSIHARKRYTAGVDEAPRVEFEITEAE